MHSVYANLDTGHADLSKWKPLCSAFEQVRHHLLAV